LFRLLRTAGELVLAGNLFITSLEGDGNLYISKSVDRGQSLNPPHLLLHAGIPDATYGVDKEWMAVNPYRATPTFNRTAVAFTWQGGSNQIHCLYSDDGGSTWSQPKRRGSRDVTFALPYFLPDGSLAVLYYRFLNGYRAVRSSSWWFPRTAGRSLARRSRS
jgi:hypothetical protein